MLQQWRSTVWINKIYQTLDTRTSKSLLVWHSKKNLLTKKMITCHIPLFHFHIFYCENRTNTKDGNSGCQIRDCDWKIVCVVAVMPSVEVVLEAILIQMNDSVIRTQCTSACWSKSWSASVMSEMTGLSVRQRREAPYSSMHASPTKWLLLLFLGLSYCLVYFYLTSCSEGKWRSQIQPRYPHRHRL